MVKIQDIANAKIGDIAAGAFLAFALIGSLSAIDYFTQSSSNDQNSAILREISEINTKLDLIEYRLNQIEMKLEILNNYITKQYTKDIAGDITQSENSIFNISITTPTNNSRVPERFSVKGKTDKTLYDDSYIYVISKAGDKYWIITDGSNDATGHWCAYRDCIIPGDYNNSILMVIISQKGYRIAESFNDIPEHISISDPVYVYY